MEPNPTTGNDDAHSVTPTTGNDVTTDITANDDGSVEATQLYSQRHSSNNQPIEADTEVEVKDMKPSNRQSQQKQTTELHDEIAAPNCGSTPVADVSDADNAEYYTVEKVSKKRMMGGKPYYLVYWQEGGSSWECEEILNELAL
jgi:hypothetical protein